MVEEHIREFEQLKMRVGSNEEPELKIARFIEGLSPNIISKVYLYPYPSFDYVCNLAIKVTEQLQDKKSFFHTSLTKVHPLTMTLKPQPHKSRLLIRKRKLLVIHLRG